MNLFGVGPDQFKRMETRMTYDETQAAIHFNTTQTLWKVADLPAPYNGGNPDTEAFVSSVVGFQQSHGLTADGMLGRGTLSAMRANQQAQGKPTAPHQCSNVVIADGHDYPLPQALIDAGVTCSNYRDDGETHFKAVPRTKPVTHLVIHESVTSNGPSTVNTLVAQGYGVHLMVAPDGHVVQHNDLVKDVVVHGNQLNGSSIGFEVVCPYSAQHVKAPFDHTIPATWWTWVPTGAPKLYVTPTVAQMATIKVLIPWLTTIVPSLPLAYPTKDLGPAKKKIDGWDQKVKPPSGIVAHRDFASHADGRYILEALIKG